ncbi:hypothetical protein C7M84_021345 [Penaeus vannamei]|uniref:Uncharacterized protein n=1 Tax=Penaeus vannamei TaxID=6689 RepID=A0A423S9U2_PENVA|nr:hypothetical protein C7M84_021345 [Penaeus vannamei]
MHGCPSEAKESAVKSYSFSCLLSSPFEPDAWKQHKAPCVLNPFSLHTRAYSRQRRPPVDQVEHQEYNRQDDLAELEHGGIVAWAQCATERTLCWHLCLPRSPRQHLGKPSLFHLSVYLFISAKPLPPIFFLFKLIFTSLSFVVVFSFCPFLSFKFLSFLCFTAYFLPSFLLSPFCPLSRSSSPPTHFPSSPLPSPPPSSPSLLPSSLPSPHPFLPSSSTPHFPSSSLLLSLFPSFPPLFPSPSSPPFSPLILPPHSFPPASSPPPHPPPPLPLPLSPPILPSSSSPPHLPSSSLPLPPPSLPPLSLSLPPLFFSLPTSLLSLPPPTSLSPPYPPFLSFPLPTSHLPPPPYLPSPSHLPFPLSSSPSPHLPPFHPTPPLTCTTVSFLQQTNQFLPAEKSITEVLGREFDVWKGKSWAKKAL